MPKFKALLIASILIVSILIYFVNNHFKPFRIGNNISKLEIPYKSKVITFKHFVNDFDGSTSTKIYFKIPDDKLNDIEQQCLKWNYNGKPLSGFSLGSDSSLFINGAKNYYYLYKSYQPQPRGYDFVLFNKEKKMLYILTERVF